MGERRRLSPAEYPDAAKAAGRSGVRPAEELAAAFERYEAAKRNQAVLDFDDVIEQCSVLLEGNSDIAAKIRAQYSCFVVDEDQDTDPSQERLLSAWLGARDNVTVVGAEPRLPVYATDRRRGEQTDGPQFHRGEAGRPAAGRSGTSAP
ncbi:UvrD-helicase domain-containing protein [Amycolatopsis vastitatis]|uniref:UvrD-helicase domain-containing protein n=1 Tax=Amycolatopsis vastitatis TaxID=1905142 RepID=UPI0013044E73|nr:UvrD-helicase domain-containing protein [Amycolatopsis vastitatis]